MSSARMAARSSEAGGSSGSHSAKRNCAGEPRRVGAHCTRSGCSALAMRAHALAPGNVVCPASSCMRVVSIATLSIVCAVGSKRASVPARPARYVHHSSMLTGSLPPQLTVTAGTEAAASSRGTMARMSSACSGW